MPSQGIGGGAANVEVEVFQTGKANFALDDVPRMRFGEDFHGVNAHFAAEVGRSGQKHFGSESVQSMENPKSVNSLLPR